MKGFLVAWSCGLLVAGSAVAMGAGAGSPVSGVSSDKLVAPVDILLELVDSDVERGTHRLSVDLVSLASVDEWKLLFKVPEGVVVENVLQDRPVQLKRGDRWIEDLLLRAEPGQAFTAIVGVEVVIGGAVLHRIEELRIGTPPVSEPQGKVRVDDKGEEIIETPMIPRKEAN